MSSVYIRLRLTVSQMLSKEQVHPSARNVTGFGPGVHLMKANLIRGTV